MTPEKPLLLKAFLQWVSPPLVGAITGLLGHPIVVALLFGFITKFTLYFLEKEIKAVALWFRRKTCIIRIKIIRRLRK